MADGHTPPEWAGWVGPALGALATAFVGVLGLLGVRSTAKASKADPQAAINDGFTELLGEMRQELIAASRERNALKRTLDAERATWALERQEFMGQIAQLQAVAEGFERLLRRNGIALPERKTLAGPPQVVETTLRQDEISSPAARPPDGGDT